MSLNKTANMLVTLAAAVFIGTTAYDRLAPSRQSRPGSGAQQAIAERFMGKSLPLPDGPAPSAAVTAVLFVSKSCHFCSPSMPFYQRLSNARKPGQLALVATVPKRRETREDGVAYLSQNSLAVNSVASVDFPGIGVMATPTLALLDGSGQMRATWTGLLEESRQDEVLTQIKKLCPSCAVP